MAKGGLKYLVMRFAWIWIFFFAIKGYAQIPKLYVHESFENADWLTKNWVALQACCEYSFVRSDSIARQGAYSARVELRQGVIERSEVYSPSPPTLFVDTWTRASIFLPSNGFQADSGYALPLQWHNTPDPGELDISPPVALEVYKKIFRIAARWDDEPVTTNADIDGSTYYNLPAWETDVWYDFIFHIRFSYLNDGILEVWYRKSTDAEFTKVVERVNQPIGYNDIRGPYFKCGLYKPDFNDSFLTKLILFLDAIDITSNTMNFLLGKKTIQPFKFNR